MNYIYSTQKLGITFEPNLELNVYIDASYGVHPDGKSQTGVTICMGKGPIFARSVKQKIVSKSSTESELIALSDACSQVISTRNFITAQGLTIGPANVYQDNQSVMHLIKNGFSNSERTRHINIRYFWLKDRMESGDIKIIYLKTEDMIADILTKPIQGKLFIKLRSLLLNWYLDV